MPVPPPSGQYATLAYDRSATHDAGVREIAMFRTSLHF
jgi:hypothetical protein